MKVSKNYLRRFLSLSMALLMVCSFSLPSVALAADLSDSSAESSISSMVEQEEAEDADTSVPALEGEAADGSTSLEEETPSQDKEIAASKDDDVGSSPEQSEPEQSQEEPEPEPEQSQEEPEPEPEQSTDGKSVPEQSAEPEPASEPVTDPADEAPEADASAEESYPIDPYADDGAGEGGQREDVAKTPHMNLMTLSASRGASSTVEINSHTAGVNINYSADGVTTFNAGSLSPGQVWVDKSVTKTNSTETSFEETLSIYGDDFTSTSEYSTGNYVLVLDTTRSLYNADHSGKLVKAVTEATNDIVVEICKNPLSNVAVVGFSADNRERDNNQNADATTVILGMGNWHKAGKKLLKCDTTNDNECKWYIGATDEAKNSKIASTSKRYISYGTFTQAGIAHAASILRAQSDKEDTAGYMLILTDGVPTYGTTKWAANYDTSNGAWQSKSSSNIGNGGGAVPEAAAYCLLTMQYWNKVLKSEYGAFKMLTAHFSNDGYDSGEEAMAKWCVGVTQKVTYSAGTGNSRDDKGYIGTMITKDWPKNRLDSTYTGSKKDDLKTAANELKKLMTADNLKKLGLSSSSDFPAPALAQFANLSSQSSADNKATALEHVFDNLQNMIKKDKTTQGALKPGTSVTFTTRTGDYMVATGAPVLYYNNTAYKGTKSGNTYSYTIAGMKASVTVNTSGNRSAISCTIPADLVNKNALDKGTHPIQCKFGVDVHNTNYLELYKAVGGDFITYTNEYSSEQTTVTYTTDKENPYYSATGTDKANKAANTTGTLSYVSQIVKAKSGKQSKATLGNNGKLTVKFNWGIIDISVWEINQKDETKILPGVVYHLADENGRKIILDGKELTFTSGATPQTIEGVPAGNYKIVADTVPAGYVPPEDTSITVKKQAKKQHYDIYVPTILIDVWAIDKATEEKVEGVKATIVDKKGRAVYENVPLEFIREYVPAGDYTIRVTTVPDRYQYPADTPITVKAIRDKQDFIIPLEHLGSITIRKTNDHGDPVQGVSYDLADSTGRVIMTRTTDKNGVAVFMDRDKLVVGEYIITETKTGAGLTLLSDSIRATIPMTMTDAEVRAKRADPSKGWHNTRTGTWYFYDLTFNITNSSRFQMPMAGDVPTILRLCMIIGMTGLLSGSAYLVFRKRTASSLPAIRH